MVDLRPLAGKLVSPARSKRDGRIVKSKDRAARTPLAMVLTAALSSVAAIAAPTAANALSSSHTSATRVWTTAEMKAATAKPLPAGRLQKPAAGTARAQSVAEPLGAPGFTPSHAPTDGPYAGAARIEAARAAAAPESDDELGAKIDATTAATPPTGTYPSPYSRFKWAGGFAKFPVVTIGKLFFKQNGVPHFCSAVVVNSDRIMTAGHCVHGGDNSESSWSTEMMFCPAYRNGPSPALGCWAVTSLVAAHDWYTSGDLDRDWGGGRTAPCGTVQCKDVGTVTGWLGYGWNFQGEHVLAFGYPQDAPFDGSKLVTCAGQNLYTDNMGVGADSKYVGCDMTGGASGGPWILRFGEWNVLDGINSHKRCTDSDCLDLEIGAAPFTTEPGGVTTFMGDLMNAK